MIEQIVKQYDFSDLPWRNFGEPAILDPVFVVDFKAVPSKLTEGPLFSSPALRVHFGNKTEADVSNLFFNRRSQNYFSAKSADGSCMVMEASLTMECDAKPWVIGFPVVLAGDQDIEHHFTLLFDGVFFNILCDGEVMDREAPEGVVKHDYDNFGGRFIIHTDRIKDLRFCNVLDKMKKFEKSVFQDIPIAYYTPNGFNTWVGDVVTFVHEGVFHIFYLHDRRHHQSRRGKGAHEFWHMTSRDLKNWVDHGPVLELTEQWQSTGTGNAFVCNGKLHLSFGWHTERAKPWNERANILLENHFRIHGNTGEFDYSQLGTLTPGGASYLSSEDGIRFTPSDKLMHFLENPSIFVQQEGTLNLYQEGKWESDHLGHWRLVDKDFPPRFENSFARNNADCPTFFSLAGWDYFMVGFSAFFGRPSGTEEWIDFTEKGWDPYDGANVPMAAEFNGRMIEGSWPGGNGWGSCMLLRELIPLGNGRIGKRWVPETLPDFKDAVPAEKEQILPDGGCCLIEADIDPSEGKFTAFFSGKEGETPVEFSLDAANLRAQWNSVPGRTIKTFREKVQEHPAYNFFHQYNDIVPQCRDYAKDNLIGLDKPFTLKLLVWSNRKMDTTLIDAELGGKHIMLTHRCDLHADKVVFSGGKNIRIRRG